MFDFHTHRLDTPPGTGIVSLPQNFVLNPNSWQAAKGGLYAAGIHPWWTADVDFQLDRYLQSLRQLLDQPEVVQVGECGLDRLRGAELARQVEVLEAQVELSETYEKGMTLHVVRAFDVLLSVRKRLRPRQTWTVHGFRGGAALARQLLAAGLDLSFGAVYNPEAFEITPEDRRRRESDSE